MLTSWPPQTMSSRPQSGNLGLYYWAHEALHQHHVGDAQQHGRHVVLSCAAAIAVVGRLAGIVLKTKVPDGGLKLIF